MELLHPLPQQLQEEHLLPQQLQEEQQELPLHRQEVDHHSEASAGLELFQPRCTSPPSPSRCPSQQGMGQ